MSVARILREAGLSDAEAAAKAALLARVEEGLQASGGRPAAIRLFAPGRIEVLGKHTDYAGGRSLLVAVERGFCLAAAPRDDNRVRLSDVGRGLEAEVALDPEAAAPREDWTVYAATVARRVAWNFPDARTGADIAFASDLPRSSGLSSSSALVVALFAALSDVNSLPERSEYRAAIESLEDLGGYLGCLENGRTFKNLAGDFGVGTFGGSEDQTAILCCRPSEVAQYAFCPVRHERSIPLPEGFTFVVASSGIAADKAGSARDKYNRLSLAASALTDLWNRRKGRSDATLADAAASSPKAAEEILAFANESPYPTFDPAFLAGRFRQFLEEATHLIPSAADALAVCNLAAFGTLVERSQDLAEKYLGNQIPETIALVRAARQLGAAAASAFGAGFGGSVWALVDLPSAHAFLESWKAVYARSFPERAGAAEFFLTRPGPGLLRLPRGPS
jgi:galactokinase